MSDPTPEDQVRASTDPEWVKKQVGLVPVSYVDGRHARVTTTKNDILRACRALMAGGHFRPDVVEVAALAKRSARSVYEHFKSVDGLYTEAIKDPDTRLAILEHTLGVDWEIALKWVSGIEDPAERIMRALIFGKAPHERT